MAESEARATGAPAAASAQQRGRETVAAAGGLLGAIAASSCCVLPLVLFSVGVTGAWMGNLVALQPYQPLFIAATLGFLGYGYYLAFWRTKRACAADGGCARPAPRRLVKTTLIVATVLVTAAVAYPFVAPIFLTA